MAFNRAALIEQLADIEHEQWMEWSKAVASDISSPERLERWKTSWVPYNQLDEKSKDLDREWVEEIMKIIEPLLEEKQKSATPVKELVTKFEVDSAKYPALAAVLSERSSLLQRVLAFDESEDATPIDPNERKKFKTTLKNWMNENYKYIDLDLKEVDDNWMKLEVGDLIADGLDSAGMESLKDNLADLFYNMKTKHTYKTITPNWWGPETAQEQAEGVIMIGLGQEDEGDPFDTM